MRGDPVASRLAAGGVDWSVRCERGAHPRLPGSVHVVAAPQHELARDRAGRGLRGKEARLGEPLLQILQDGNRLADDELPVLEDRDLGERVQAAKRRLAMSAAQDVDLDLLVRDALLAQHDAHATRDDGEGMPVQAEHRRRDQCCPRSGSGRTFSAPPGRAVILAAPRRVTWSTRTMAWTGMCVRSTPSNSVRSRSSVGSTTTAERWPKRSPSTSTKPSIELEATERAYTS